MTVESSEHDDFETEARERLASIETRQATIESSIEDLAQGQDELNHLLTELDDNLASQDDLDEVKKNAQDNAEFRQETLAVMKFIVAALSLSGGFTGVLMVML